MKEYKFSVTNFSKSELLMSPEELTLCTTGTDELTAAISLVTPLVSNTNLLQAASIEELNFLLEPSLIQIKKAVG